MIQHTELGNVVVYTAITNNRDTLKDPIFVNNFEYVCFSDKPVESEVWKYRQIPSGIHAHRQCKILAMEYFPGYAYSIWQDGSMTQTSDLTPLIRGLKPYDMACFPHRARKSVYDEVDACIQLNKWDVRALNRQRDAYANENFVSDRLFETGVIVRRHTQDTKKLGEIWWEQIKQYTPRDQISLPYALTKIGMYCGNLVGSVSNNMYFDHSKHNSYDPYPFVI